jgi:hypothetical protein
LLPVAVSAWEQNGQQEAIGAPTDAPHFLFLACGLLLAACCCFAETWQSGVTAPPLLGLVGRDNQASPRQPAIARHSGIFLYFSLAVSLAPATVNAQKMPTAKRFRGAQPKTGPAKQKGADKYFPQAAEAKGETNEPLQQKSGLVCAFANPRL